MVSQDSMKWQTEIWKLLFLIRFFWIRFFFRVCCFYLPVQQVWLDVDAACRGALPAVSDRFFSWRSPFFLRHHLLLCFKAPSRRNKAHSRKLWRFFVLQTFWFQTYLHIRRTAPPSWREWHQHLNCRNLEGKVMEKKPWEKYQKHGNFCKKKVISGNIWQICCSQDCRSRVSFWHLLGLCLWTKKTRRPLRFERHERHRSLKLETFRRKKRQLIGEISTNNVPKACLSLSHPRKLRVQRNLNILRILSVSDLLFLVCSGKDVFLCWISSATGLAHHECKFVWSMPIDDMHYTLYTSILHCEIFLTCRHACMHTLYNNLMYRNKKLHRINVVCTSYMCTIVYVLHPYPTTCVYI